MSQAAWAKVPERGSLWVMRTGIKILNLFGYWAGVAIGFFAALYFFATGAVSRRASRDYLRRLNQTRPDAVGPATLWRCFRHHWSFALNVIDRIWLWQGKFERFRFTWEGREFLEGARERGFLLVGAHFGSFDAMRAFSGERGLTLRVVMYRAHAQKINALFKELNPLSNAQVFELDGSDVDQIFQLQEAVDRGEIVAILGDRPAPYGKQRMTAVPFLGEPASFPQNPWILAGLLECPVYLAYGVRSGLRRYHIAVEPFADRIEIPRKVRQERLRDYMARYARRLEGLCARHPYQWFNFYDFWK